MTSQTRREFLTTAAAGVTATALWPPTAPTLLRRASAEKARRSLREFIAQAWHVLEPGPFVPGFHIDAICAHLEAVTHGHIRQLVINIPPRHMKSLSVSVFWPCWEWIDHPERRWLFTSYALHLSIRDSVKCRRLIDSAWYQERWGDRFRLTTDQNTKIRFDNDKTGYRIAAATGGVMGEGGDRTVVDDPHNVQEAESDDVRQGALDSWDLAMSTRLNDPRRSARVIVMQRLHERDLTGHVLERTNAGEWVHLCLPARYDGPRSKTPLTWTDRRTMPGELLWPERFGEKELAELEAQLLDYGTAGQLQQRPVPKSGGLFKREWFRIVEAVPDDVVRWCRFWDGAASEEKGDYTVGLLMGQRASGGYIIADVERGRWGPGDCDTVMQTTCEMDAKRYSNYCIREEQEPGSAGKKLIYSHALLFDGYDYNGEPATGDKETRAKPLASQMKVGNVVLLSSDRWNKPFIDELCSFPRGKHDDQVDAASGAHAELALGGAPFREVPLTGY